MNPFQATPWWVQISPKVCHESQVLQNSARNSGLLILGNATDSRQYDMEQTKNMLPLTDNPTLGGVAPADTRVQPTSLIRLTAT